MEASSGGLDSEFAAILARASHAAPPVLEFGTDYEKRNRRIADAMKSVKRLGKPLTILEAGCGNRWWIDLKGVDHKLIGVDLDPEALRIRTQVHQDLNEALVGDICTTVLPRAEFDTVYSAYVLEHIERADLALTNMISALRPGGILIIALPDPESAKGFVTRYTPFWFHVLFARYVEGSRNAGKPGYAPYPTHYHPAIWRKQLLALADTNKLSCFWIISEASVVENRGLIGLAIRTALSAISLLSFGKVRRHTNVIYFFRRHSDT